VVDPGETVTLNFGLQNSGGAATANLVATLQASGGVSLPSAPRIYGALAAGGGSATQPFSFLANGACGGSVTATLQLQDGATSLGNVSFNIPLGQIVNATTLAQSFDTVVPPALPAGWMSVVITGAVADWTTTGSAYDTGPNSAFIPDSPDAGENGLVSPVIPISSASAQLTFRHNYNLESHTKHATTYFDGGVLEIQIGNGGFTDITTAGGSFVTGGYTGRIDSHSGNPLGGQQAWVGDSAGWIITTVNLPASAAGQAVQFRWNCGTDSANNYSAIGWYVDSIALSDTTPVCCAPSSISMPTISTEPSNQVVIAGTDVNFSVTATGAPLPAYQWRFNGVNLPGATASTLTLTYVQPAQAGTYSVLVANSAGALASSGATLRVLVAPLLTPLPGTRFQASLAGVTGLVYTLEYKNSLNDPVWTSLSPSLTGTGGILLLQDTNAITAARFYRVRCD
jgi:hypothetical protein